MKSSKVTIFISMDATVDFLLNEDSKSYKIKLFRVNTFILIINFYLHSTKSAQSWHSWPDFQSTSEKSHEQRHQPMIDHQLKLIRIK
jgi:hypothetical protein